MKSAQVRSILTVALTSSMIRASDKLSELSFPQVQNKDNNVHFTSAVLNELTSVETPNWFLHISRYSIFGFFFKLVMRQHKKHLQTGFLKQNMNTNTICATLSKQIYKTEEEEMQWNLSCSTFA